MRIIYRIAKLELSTMFYSPVAWLVLVVFAFQAGMGFMDSMEKLDTMRQMGYLKSLQAGLTFSVFSDPSALFFDMQSKLYLYIPLLTMGLLSRETSSGSIKLLLSSPIKMREIILGKFGAMMAYGLILICILLLFVIAAGLTINSLDIKLVFSGLLGLYLLLCAYSAIGLYMSSLTSYQVVAAISTLVVLGILNYIGELGQKVEYVRDVTQFLSLAGRSNMILTGLINSRDVMYFIIVVALFLGLSTFKLQFAREAKTTLVKTGQYSLLIGTLLLIGYFISKPIFISYFDMTTTKNMTLTPNSQKVLNTHKDRLTITTYVNILDKRATWVLPQNKVTEFANFESYLRFVPRTKMEYVYYYDSCANAREVLSVQHPGLSLDQLAQKIAEAYKIDMSIVLKPAQIRKIIDLRPEENRLVRQIESGGKKVFLRMFEDMWSYPGEGEITAAIRKFNTVSPKVAFLTGHNERSIEKMGDRDFKFPSIEKTFRFSLINQGFEVNALSIKDQDVPQDVSILVIADPRLIFDAQEQARIIAYINRGGNLLIAGEPDKTEVLNPVLATLGVQYIPGSIVYVSEVDPFYNVRADLTKNTTELFASRNHLYKPQEGKIYSHIAMPGAMGIKWQEKGGFKVTPVLATKDSSNCWNTTRKIEQDSVPRFIPKKGDTRKSFTTAIALKRKAGNKEQRIMIFGDADFMNNFELTRGAQSGYSRLNFPFYHEIMKWLGNDDSPLDVSRPPARDLEMKVKTAGITTMKSIFLGGIPGMLILFSSVLLIMRRRK